MHLKSNVLGFLLRNTKEILQLLILLVSAVRDTKELCEVVGWENIQKQVMDIAMCVLRKVETLLS